MRNCDKCGTELKKVFEEGGRRYNDFPQYEDALIIDLHGGYGMLIDPAYYASVPAKLDNTRFILCKVCGTELVRNNEFMHSPETEHLLEVEDEEFTPDISIT